VSLDPSYPQDRPAGPPPTEPVPQAYPPSSGPQGYQPYAPSPDGRIAFPPPGPTVDHPQATLAFVLGLLSILGLLILGPFGWYYGRKVVREIDRDPRAFGNRGLAMAGMVLGIVATAFMVLLGLLLGVAIALLLVAGSR
jgi:MFS family permease